MERRDFIKHTAAIASVSAVSGIVDARPATDSPRAGDEKCVATVVLVDERFSDSRQFAAFYAARGARVISLAHDIGRIWYGELRDHCSLATAVVAGLTLHTDLFVSQQFARECKKKFIAVGTHDCRGRGTLIHTVPANAALDLLTSASWANDVARYMALSKSHDGARSVTQSTSVARSGDHPGSLYSWMIV